MTVVEGEETPKRRSRQDEADPALAPPDAIRQALRRILVSSEFEGTNRSRDFLQFVVEETLQGRAERIKAYTIATEVFGRDSDFDAQNDPIVRVEAGRLRRALERYYLVAGVSNSVTIDIPKGGYVPTFTHQATPDEPDPSIDAPVHVPESNMPPLGRIVLTVGAAIVLTGLLAGGASWLANVRLPAASMTAHDIVALPGPTIHIARFARLDDADRTAWFADGLAEEITAQLARFRELTILERDAGADYSLDGSVRRDGSQMRITARLADSGSGRVLWSDIYEYDLDEYGAIAIEEDIAQTIATAIAQPGGVIFRPAGLGDNAGQARERDAYDCTLAFYTYRSAITPERHADVRECLRTAVAQYPGFATAWSLLAYIYIDEYRFEFNPEPDLGPAIDRALQAARQAVRLDPANARASQALMTALFYDMQVEEALNVGEEAVARNPNDTELLGEFGIRLGQAGYWERGDRYLQLAVDRNPSLATMYNIALAQSAYMRGDPERAVHLIRIADMQKFPFFYGISALIYADAGMDQEAAEARRLFLERWPRFFDDIESELIKRYFSSADRAKIIADARKAGFPVPESLGGIGLESD